MASAPTCPTGPRCARQGRRCNAQKAHCMYIGMDTHTHTRHTLTYAPTCSERRTASSNSSSSDKPPSAPSRPPPPCRPSSSACGACCCCCPPPCVCVYRMSVLHVLPAVRRPCLAAHAHASAGQPLLLRPAAPAAAPAGAPAGAGAGAADAAGGCGIQQAGGHGEPWLHSTLGVVGSAARQTAVTLLAAFGNRPRRYTTCANWS